MELLSALFVGIALGAVVFVLSTVWLDAYPRPPKPTFVGTRDHNTAGSITRGSTTFHIPSLTGVRGVVTKEDWDHLTDSPKGVKWKLTPTRILLQDSGQAIEQGDEGVLAPLQFHLVYGKDIYMATGSDEAVSFAFPGHPVLSKFLRWGNVQTSSEVDRSYFSCSDVVFIMEQIAACPRFRVAVDGIVYEFQGGREEDAPTTSDTYR